MLKYQPDDVSELETQDSETPPDRDAMSLMNSNLAIPVNLVLASSVVSSGVIAAANAQRATPIDQARAEAAPPTTTGPTSTMLSDGVTAASARACARMPDGRRVDGHDRPPSLRRILREASRIALARGEACGSATEAASSLVDVPLDRSSESEPWWYAEAVAPALKALRGRAASARK